ncbi:MAG: hypothetical protein NUV69_03790 [Candidatus Curtissbacteria bacterium]|nr:hypothetical protein [Candidatus Curtissbacteria bacterium]
MTERQASAERKTVWDSRLFKAGAVLAVAGAGLGIAVFMSVGVVSMGAGWALMKGKQ